VAKEYGKITDNEEIVEPETETTELVSSDTDESRPQRPARAAGPGDKGGRRAKSAAAQPGFVARTSQFIRDTRAEMRRVSWPSANDVKNTTVITLVAVIFFALYLFGIDRVWAFLIDHLRSWLGG
jgi:preprotein translocase subunit SecE